MTLEELTMLRKAYEDRELTLDGYVLAVIDCLSLKQIRLRWLADQMGVSYSGLAKSTTRLRKKGKINIPTVDPRLQHKPRISN